MRPTQAIQLCAMLLWLLPLAAMVPLGDMLRSYDEAVQQVSRALRASSRHPYLERHADLLALVARRGGDADFSPRTIERQARKARHGLRLLGKVTGIRSTEELLQRPVRQLGKLGDAVWTRLSDFDLRRVAYAFERPLPHHLPRELRQFIRVAAGR